MKKADRLIYKYHNYFWKLLETQPQITEQLKGSNQTQRSQQLKYLQVK